MNKPDDKNLLWRYAGLTFQFLVGIGLFVFLGMKIDEWLKLPMPVAVWVLPLLLIAVIMVRIIKDTAQKK